jgi:hypothetical protein
MQPTCETCGRALSAPENAAPGAPVQVTCTCGHTQALRVVPRPPPRKAALAVGPLPSPRGGENFEVDPWSLPPPEDGYENLVLDDGRPGAAPSARKDPVEPPPAPEPAREAAAEPSPARPEPAAAPADAPRIARSRLILLGAVAAVVVLGALAAAIVRTPSTDESPARAGVRVTVTQEAPSWAAPPLAPMDPSYVERRRPDAAPARPAAAPPRATATRPASRPPSATATSAAPAAPEPIPSAAAPEEEPAPEPAVSAPAPEIPLPPPPVLAAPSPPARAPAAAVRPPVLQTRSCVEDALRVPRGMEGRLPPEVVLRVEVGEDGLPANVSVGAGVEPRLASALAAAVRTCRFAPGSGADGRPAAQPTTMRVRFAP